MQQEERKKSKTIEVQSCLNFLAYFFFTSVEYDVQNNIMETIQIST